MFRQLKVPVLGMIENMEFFDVVAYLRERGGPGAQQADRVEEPLRLPRRRAGLPVRPRRGGAAEQLASLPRRGAPEIFLREPATQARSSKLCARLPARPYLLGVVEQLAAQISIQNIKTPKMPKLEVIG